MGGAWLAWVYLASEWAIRIAMAPVVVRKRSPSTAAAWLLVIFFLPWLGLALYLIAGEPRLGRRRSQRHRQAILAVRQAHPLERLERFEAQAKVPPAHRDIVKLTERIAALPVVGGSSCQFFASTEAVVSQLVRDIDAAQRHVHLETFIYEPDETGVAVAQALERAAARGAACRLLVDDVGSRRMLRRLAPRLRRAGVEVVSFFPVNPLRAHLERLDIRNHRKLAVVDGAVGWAGSQNIVNPDYGERRFGPWRDVMVRYEGPAAAQLQCVFLEDWRSQTQTTLEGVDLFPELEVRGDIAVQTAPSGPGPRSAVFTELLIASLNEAEQRAVMTTPYFVPDEPLLTTLRILALRGVEVDLAIPARSNHPIVQAAGRAYLGELLEAGVRVHLHGRGLLHAKTLSVDDSLALVGSGNFDIRSFNLNYELTQTLYGSVVARQLRDIQGVYLAESTPLTLAQWRSRPVPLRLADDVAKLFSPIL